MRTGSANGRQDQEGDERANEVPDSTNEPGTREHVSDPLKTNSFFYRIRSAGDDFAGGSRLNSTRPVPRPFAKGKDDSTADT
jgi:hypothetical protein